MRSPRNSKLRAGALSIIVLSALGILGSSSRSFGAAHSEILGDAAVQLEGYTQKAGSFWSAVMLVTNISKVKIECLATSYPPGLAQGSQIVPAKELNTNTLPKTLVWTRRQPETSVDPRLLQRYRLGEVFQLEPEEGRRFMLPILVPEAHPNSFREHLVFGYKRIPGSADTAAFNTYVAEVKQP
jgi:hypothetical protein